jgi:phage terminase large subunit-like protein
MVRGNTMITDTTIKLPVTVMKNPGRKSGYTATYGQYPGDIRAEGVTAAEARSNLTAMLVTAVATITEAKPRFARDDSGAVWAAVPAFDGGSRWWRVTGECARENTWTDTPASESFTSCVGMTVMPAR